jgi:hypothetical protein
MCQNFITGDSPALRRALDERDLVTGAYFAYIQDSHVKARPMVRHPHRGRARPVYAEPRMAEQVWHDLSRRSGSSRR